jgi:hypothetical protein
MAKLSPDYFDADSDTEMHDEDDLVRNEEIGDGEKGDKFKRYLGVDGKSLPAEK